MNRLPDGSYLFGQRPPLNRHVTSWLLHTVFIGAFMGPFVVWYGPMVAVFALFTIGQYTFECWRKDRKDREARRIDLPATQLAQIGDQLRLLGVRNMRIHVQDSDDYTAPYVSSGHLYVSSQAIENWSDVSINWSIRRAVLGSRVLTRMFAAFYFLG